MLPSSVGHWNREEFRNIVVFASMLGSSRGLKYGQTVQCNTSLCLMFLQLLLLLMLPAGQCRGPRDPGPRCVRHRHFFSLTRSRLANFVVVYMMSLTVKFVAITDGSYWLGIECVVPFGICS